MSAAELQLHDIDKLNNIVKLKLKQFVADFNVNKIPLSPEVKEVLHSKAPGQQPMSRVCAMNINSLIVIAFLSTVILVFLVLLSKLSTVYHRRNKLLPLFWMAVCVFKILREYQHPANILLSAVFMFFWYDFFSGLLHIVLDNPEFIPFPVLGTPCLEFQWHHHIPMDLASKHFLETCGDLNTVTCLLGVIYFAVSDLSSVGTCLAAFKVLFAYFGQYCHCMAHTPAHRRPAWVSALQRAGVMVSPQEHGRHHQTYDDNFCIGSGVCNPLVSWCTRTLPANKYFWLASFLLCAGLDVVVLNHVLVRYLDFE